jgi:hypothetical protein
VQQRNRREQVGAVLLAHRPKDFRLVSCRIAEGAKDASNHEGRQRNRTLYRAGLRLFGYVAGGLLDHAEVQARLEQAARGCGLGQREAAATIRSAATVGLTHPKGVPDQRPTPTGQHQPEREARTRRQPEDRDRHR